MEHLFFKHLSSALSLSDNRKCDPFVAAAGLAAGAGLVSSLISGRANKKLVRETNAQNRAMFDEQMRQQAQQFQMSQDYATMDWKRNRQAAIEDWERETAYNDPAAQKQRYRNAGINPALAMQGQNQAVASMESTAGGSSPSPGGMPGIPQMQTPVDTTADAVARATSSYLQARATESEARLKEEQTQQLSIDNKSREEMNIVELANKRQDLELKQQQYKKGSREYEILGKNIDLLDDQIALNFSTFDARVKQMENQNYATAMQASKMNEETQILQIQKQFEWRMQNARLQVTEMQARGIAQDIRESASRINLNDKNAEKAVADAAFAIAQKNGLPGADTPQGRQAVRAIEAEIYSKTKSRVTGPFGSGFDMPGYHFGPGYTDPLGPYRMPNDTINLRNTSVKRR